VTQLQLCVGLTTNHSIKEIIMNVSSATSSYASQTVLVRPPQQENIQHNNQQRSATPAPSPAASPVTDAAPTVNTSGQTVGRLINISA
jgi:hypothetical protein